MVALVTGEVQKDHIYIFLTANRKKLKVRKFDGLSSNRSGDIEENYRGGIMPPKKKKKLIRVKIILNLHTDLQTS